MSNKKKATLNMVEMKIEDLIPADYNPRKISLDAKMGLSHSIRKHGYVQNIIFNKRTGTLVSGHQRAKILADEGYETVDVSIVDLSVEEEKVLNVEMNNHMIEGEFTSDINSLLQEISDFDPETYDTTMMYGISKDLEFVPDVVDDDEEEEEEFEDPDMDIDRMKLMPFESYDAIVIICDDTQDFSYLKEKFGLRKINMSPMGGAKKIGQNRVVSAGVVIKALEK